MREKDRERQRDALKDHEEHVETGGCVRLVAQLKQAA